jgi:transposase InsO family protein
LWVARSTASPANPPGSTGSSAPAENDDRSGVVAGHPTDRDVLSPLVITSSTDTRSFDDVFRSAGVTPIRIPPRSPQANAFAERWFDSDWDPRVLLTLETRMEHGFNEWCAASAAEVPGRAA